MNTKQERKSRVVVGDEDIEVGFTQRVLMSLVVDVTYLAENAERVKVQVFAMARENGVHIPPQD
jgi:hypothetical protein